MIWLFTIIQILAIQLNWWSYNTYYMQPKHDHPAIFWNPRTRWLVLTMPWVSIIILVLMAFFFTHSPWLFLLFTITCWTFVGYRHFKSVKRYNFTDINDQLQNKDVHVEEKIIPQKEWLLNKVPQEDIFSGAIYECETDYNMITLDGSQAQKRKNQNYEVFPFSADASTEWVKFQHNIQADDEIWTFSSAKTKIKSPFHWTGVCLIRNGEIIDSIADQMHVLYRRQTR